MSTTISALICGYIACLFSVFITIAYLSEVCIKCGMGDVLTRQSFQWAKFEFCRHGPFYSTMSMALVPTELLQAVRDHCWDFVRQPNRLTQAGHSEFSLASCRLIELTLGSLTTQRTFFCTHYRLKFTLNSFQMRFPFDTNPRSTGLVVEHANRPPLLLPESRGGYYQRPTESSFSLSPAYLCSLVLFT